MGTDGAGDRVDALHCLARPVGDLPEGPRRPTGELGAGIGLGAAAVDGGNGAACLALDRQDHGPDLGRGAGGSFSQLAHLVRHHRKATPLLAGPGGFDGRIEGEQVGLVGDLADHLDDAADGLGALAEGRNHHRGILDRAGDPLDLPGRGRHDVGALD